MKLSHQLVQYPAPGSHSIMFCGDTICVTLALPKPLEGNAWLRTNIGQAKIQRSEIVRQVENDATPLGRDWFDIPMQAKGDNRFQAILPLCEVGHFQAKAYFLEKGADDPIWPRGDNFIVNVQPQDACCANIIYNAFVRQFGPHNKGDIAHSEQEAHIADLDRRGFAVIPPSGRFRDLIKRLDFIIGTLGCTIIQLLPVHPTPTTYARMGRFGSPFAALSFMDVDSAQAQFDPRATPLEQFIELVDAIHARNAKVFIDIAINHTGWGARLHESHPEWLLRDNEGRIKVPGAWGVEWADLTRLDYSQPKLWQYMATVFLTWCRRGIDGFRCDAGYMIPVPAWRYIIAKVRRQFPDTIFFLEGLGGKISATRELLNFANFNWAYSELFQNYDRSQIEHYLSAASEISKADGILLHFAETHDNTRLAARSKVWAKMRTSLCALLSHQGAFGFANGVEWYATQKIDVHDAPSLNWGAKPNQVEHIGRLSTLLKMHPCFFPETRLRLIQKGDGNTIALLRENLPSGKKLIIVCNLDDAAEQPVRWKVDDTGIGQPVYTDLITATEKKAQIEDKHYMLRLAPGEVFCLSPDPKDLGLLHAPVPFSLPGHLRHQRHRAKALEIVSFYREADFFAEFDPDQAAKALFTDPLEFCRAANPFGRETRVITWQWPQDARREVMLPPDCFLMVRADSRFRARITEGEETLECEQSLAAASNFQFALFCPLEAPHRHKSRILHIDYYGLEGCIHVSAGLLYLAVPGADNTKQTFQRTSLLRTPIMMLATNSRGGMLRAHAAWGKLQSRYDALLAANLSDEIPEDRRVMFTRCRGWIVYQGYSIAVNLDCLDAFCVSARQRGFWRFHIPTGQGEYLILTIALEMVKGQNGINMVCYRHPAKDAEGRLADDQKVKLILRPDIEDRSFHDTTKAHLGPEHHFPAAISNMDNGFVFAPEAHRRLQLSIDSGQFWPEPEWHYMVYRPLEAERGLDPDSDLFSPGYFKTILQGGDVVTLTARAYTSKKPKPMPKTALVKAIQSSPLKHAKRISFQRGLQRAIMPFIVKRGHLRSVIAGYPWFLDWGRDALIAVRGIIAAGKTPEARMIIKQFGRFEDQGTLPNMIHGDDAANRDTCDAPLWFFIACRDLIRFEKKSSFLEENCGQRSIKSILISMGHSIKNGTPNGIHMDPESGLLFSPLHFTWMDTDHPAGTPREGYPIEIQALWYAALHFLNDFDPEAKNNRWLEIADQVQSSIAELFFLPEQGYLADCLAASPGTPAARSLVDDALRPNQLFALTMGAVTQAPMTYRILDACQTLLVPGAIRSLADRRVTKPLEIRRDGQIIGDPHYPYKGKYVGDEDSQRKPAYHNGTAWTWVFPSFCEAWGKTYGPSSFATVRAWLASASELMQTGCVGHIPEIVDGDAPHTQRGCDAQAWGASEVLRVWQKFRAMP